MSKSLTTNRAGALMAIALVALFLYGCSGGAGGGASGTGAIRLQGAGTTFTIELPKKS